MRKKGVGNIVRRLLTVILCIALAAGNMTAAAFAQEEVFLSGASGIIEEDSDFFADEGIVGESAGQPAFKTFSLVLSGKIGVNFYMDLPDDAGINYSDSYMEFTVSGKGGKTTKVPYDPEFRNSNRNYYGFSCYVTSIQMADEITAVFHYSQDGEESTVETTASVEKYILSYVEHAASEPDSYGNDLLLVKALADYGHYAQIFLSAKHNWIIGDDHAEMDTYYSEYTDEGVFGMIAKLADKGVEVNRSKDITGLNCSLILDTETAICLYFSKAEGYTGGLSVDVDGAATEAVEQKDGRFKITIPNIGANKLGRFYNVTIGTDTSAHPTTISISALSYIKINLEKLMNGQTLTTDERDAMAAIYRYYAAAVGEEIDPYDPQDITQRADEILAELTLDQKAAQMVQPAIYCVNEDQMKNNCYGSILSKYDSVTCQTWRNTVDNFQRAALASEAGIPYLYGQDDVHGVNYCLNTVLFPHNIGLGAANDPGLMYEVGKITADEAKLCHMLWNFAPCVAQSVDPRWGRTYESYGSDLDIIRNLSTAYTRGLIDGGVVACAKHFFGDGNVRYGTGEEWRLIDRGDATLSEEEIGQLLEVYQALIDAGVQTIMISHSSVNGIKMHENAEYIQYLKNEMGFEGFIVSDWNSVQNTSPPTYEQKIITSVNAGIDMLMEIDRYDEARQIIVQAVQSGDISQERIDDAVRRILCVKLKEGLFDDPYCEQMETVQSDVGSEEYRAVAEKLVEESLVLVKNDNNILPLRAGTKIYVTGPAADHAQAQCGGWTLDWNGSPSKDIPGVTTILQGLRNVADDYDVEIITDSYRANEADVVLLIVGEQSYAEWNGDTSDLDLCGGLGLDGNSDAINEARNLGKTTVACIVAGRNVIIDNYDDNWDSVVMCYLPGSEGQGVAHVLLGGAPFSGTLPSPWYSNVNQIPDGTPWLPMGYGLTTLNG